MLHAINEEYVEAVEVLLDHEESIHVEGEPWVSVVKITKAKIYKLFRAGRRWTGRQPPSPLTSPP